MTFSKNIRKYCVNASITDDLGHHVGEGISFLQT